MAIMILNEMQFLFGFYGAARGRAARLHCDKNGNAHFAMKALWAFLIQFHNFCEAILASLFCKNCEVRGERLQILSAVILDICNAMLEKQRKNALLRKALL